MRPTIVRFVVFTLMLFTCVVHAQTEAEQETTLPDLHVSTLNTSPRQPCAGETTQVIVGLGNSGSVAAREFKATITIGSDEPILVPIPGLGSKQSTTVVLEHEFSVGDGARVVVEVDPQNDIKEHDESNNSVFLQVNVTDC